MKTTTPRIPSGFSEYLPGDQIEFNRLRDIIRETYERYGYAPLDTPDIELSEVLLAKGGGETEKQIYRRWRAMSPNMKASWFSRSGVTRLAKCIAPSELKPGVSANSTSATLM